MLNVENGGAKMSSDREQPVSTADMAEVLVDPGVYDHPADDVVVLQTHISWVALVGDVVYKVKKPVDFGFLDFSTVRKRRHYCHQEVELNSRLCPEIYHGVVPIRQDGDTIKVNGKRGRIIDYAVVMQRLPQERMLDHLLASGDVDPEIIDDIARKLAAFHATSDTGPDISRFGSPRQIRQNWDENFEQTTSFIGATISAEQHSYLQEWLAASMQRLRKIFKQRQETGRVRDGHGDLRASAICAVDPICIFDCIEFNKRFRYADVAADVAFLAMDLTAKGRDDLSRRFVDRYVAESGDQGLLEVIDFYICYRAFVRGKVEGFLTADESASQADREDAAMTARSRFAQAVEAALRVQPPLMLLTCGLSGTGKSAVASALAKTFDMTVIASDVVRKELAGLAVGEHAPAEFGTGIYTDLFTKRTYREMLGRARSHLEAGRSVILDATFSSEEWRQSAGRLAEERGAMFCLVECRLDEGIARERIERRAGEGDSMSDATWEIYLSQRDTFEAVTGLSEWRHVVLDTGGSLPSTLSAADTELRRRVHPAGEASG
jgi:uncharacterized protein